jgi:hypothetical protein
MIGLIKVQNKLNTIPGVIKPYILEKYKDISLSCIPLKKALEKKEKQCQNSDVKWKISNLRSF